jgi:hypothetical protein
LLTAVTFFQNAPFFTNKILFFKNLILKIKYIKIKKKKKKKRGGRTTPMGVAGHPLGHGGGSATPRSAGLGVAEPPPWPKGQPATPYGVVRPPLFFFLFFHRLKGGGSATPLGHGGGSATPRLADLGVAEPPL